MIRTRWVCAIALLATAAGCDDFEPPDSGPPIAVAMQVDAGGAAAGPPTPSQAPAVVEGDAVTDDGGASPEFTLARASRDYVWIPNPREHGLTVVDAASREVRQVPAGIDPAYFGVSPMANVAVVIDAASSRGFVLRASRNDVDRTIIDVVPDANAVAFSPDARHAVVYSSPRFVSRELLSGAAQEISLVSLVDGDTRSVRVTVGARPRRVEFAEDGTRAFVVTETGISRLDFRAVLDDENPLAIPLDFGREVDVTELMIEIAENGLAALGYVPGTESLHLLNMDTGQTRSIEMGQLPVLARDEDAGLVDLSISDVGLVDEGDFALIMLPGDGRVVFAPLPDVFIDPAQATAATLDDPLPEGVTISGNRRWALVYSPEARRVALVDLEQPESTRRIDLAATPSDVAFFEDDDGAAILYGGDEPGFGALDLLSGFTKYRSTKTLPLTTAYAPSWRLMFALVRDDADSDHRLYEMDLENFAVASLELDSPPTALGYVPGADDVFVHQEHVDGRLTLLDLETATTETLTGILVPNRVQQ